MPTVLITGASRGIGKGFADYYAAEGWRVIATARNPDGLAGEALPLDVTSDGSVTSLVDSLAGEPIDLLINNAGITGPRGSGVGNLDYDAWGEVLAVDAIAPIRVAALTTEPASNWTPSPHVADVDSIANRLIARVSARPLSVMFLLTR